MKQITPEGDFSFVQLIKKYKNEIRFTPMRHWSIITITDLPQF